MNSIDYDISFARPERLPNYTSIVSYKGWLTRTVENMILFKLDLKNIFSFDN